MEHGTYNSTIDEAFGAILDDIEASQLTELEAERRLREIMRAQRSTTLGDPMDVVRETMALVNYRRMAKLSSKTTANTPPVMDGADSNPTNNSSNMIEKEYDQNEKVVYDSEKSEPLVTTFGNLGLKQPITTIDVSIGSEKKNPSYKVDGIKRENHPKVAKESKEKQMKEEEDAFVQYHLGEVIAEATAMANRISLNEAHRISLNEAESIRKTVKPRLDLMEKHLREINFAVKGPTETKPAPDGAGKPNAGSEDESVKLPESKSVTMNNDHPLWTPSGKKNLTLEEEMKILDDKLIDAVYTWKKMELDSKTQNRYPPQADLSSHMQDEYLEYDKYAAKLHAERTLAHQMKKDFIEYIELLDRDGWTVENVLRMNCTSLNGLRWTQKDLYYKDYKSRALDAEEKLSRQLKENEAIEKEIDRLEQKFELKSYC